MALKTKVVVLKRIRAGDQDILVKAYGSGGTVDILVREGYISTNRFFGVFEPFNLVELDLRQTSDVMIPNDVLEVKRLSYLCSEYERFEWMCWVASFVLKHIRFYDEKLFHLIVESILTHPEGRERLLRTRFKLEYLVRSGFEPKFLKESFGRGRLRVRLSDGSVREDGDVEVESYVLRTLIRLRRADRVRAQRIRRETLEKMEKLLDLLIDYHTR